MVAVSKVNLRNAVRSWPVWALHGLAFITPVLAPVSWSRVGLAMATYVVGMVAVTAGYHRYFAHRSFETSRIARFMLAWSAQSMMQKGVLWWAANHRRHHHHSDQPGDPHSPALDGAWWAHIGWTLDPSSNARHDAHIVDWLAVPELRWIDRWWMAPPLVWAGLMWAVGGWSWVGWGFLMPVIAGWHATYSVNSVCHIWGSRPHSTPDNSRNNAIIALITMGEGWHNNHHHSPRSARQGTAWWQVDVTWWVLRFLAAIGVVWSLKQARRNAPP